MKSDGPLDPQGDYVTVMILVTDWEKIQTVAQRDSRTPQRILHTAITRYVNSKKLS